MILNYPDVHRTFTFDSSYLSQYIFSHYVMFTQTCPLYNLYVPTCVLDAAFF